MSYFVLPSVNCSLNTFNTLPAKMMLMKKLCIRYCPWAVFHFIIVLIPISSQIPIPLPGKLSTRICKLGASC